MKKLLFLTSCAVAVSALAQTSVVWRHLGIESDKDGNDRYRSQFVVKGDLGNIEKIAFCQSPFFGATLNPADSLCEIIPGYYYVKSPDFAAERDSAVIDILSSGALRRISLAPTVAHGVDHQGNVVAVDFKVESITQRPEQWRGHNSDPMHYGDFFYDLNSALAYDSINSPYDIIPSFKSVRPAKKGVYKGEARGETKLIDNANKEYYRLNVTPKGITVEAASQEAANTAWRMVKRLLRRNGGTLPAAVVEDWPDLPYRGLMVDVARNFQTPQQMKKIIDLMADYRLNRLHFHLVDDEAWRFEVSALPELTGYAAHRGYTLDEKDFLAQVYSGNGDPKDYSGTANGYYTRKEMIDLLRYAQERGITVIPEIESPGHSRAARKAMEHRYATTGDSSYRLCEDGDTSQYCSAQSYYDNMMNPALPGPYKFMDTVVDELIAIYKEAGVPLESVHIGGDEVPHGAWSGSPSAVRFMAENGIEDQHAFHAYWVERMSDLLKSKGLKVAGWQDIAVGKPKSTTEKYADNVGFVNLWYSGLDVSRKDAAEAVSHNVPYLLCASSHFYFDLAYDPHPDEPGLNWAGIVDELQAFDGYADQLSNDTTLLLGVQGQLWGETIHSPQEMEYLLFPKMLGLAERGWNSDYSISKAKYNNLIATAEIPEWEADGVTYRVRMPGIKVIDGMVYMNSPYPGAQIRYTTDGTDPTPESSLYQAPIPAVNGVQYRARLFLNGHTSKSSILYN